MVNDQIKVFYAEQSCIDMNYMVILTTEIWLALAIAILTTNDQIASISNTFQLRFGFPTITQKFINMSFDYCFLKEPSLLVLLVGKSFA